MKRLFILFLSVISLVGCTDDFFYYSEISEPHLTGKPWTFVDYDIQIISSISDVEVIYNDTVCIGPFKSSSVIDDNILMEQQYGMTPIDRRFIKGVTQWEFDDSSFGLYVNGNMDIKYRVGFPNYMMKEYDKMEILNPMIGAKTTYSFESNSQGANYPTEMVLLSPVIVNDLLLSKGMRDKAVSLQVLLIFRR